MGNSGQLLVELVSELELIIGSQPEVLPLPLLESQNRFKDVFSRFLACLTSAEHPWFYLWTIYSGVIRRASICWN